MKERVAIVGTGVAGLGCAWGLRNHADLTLLEADRRPGGHTNTVTVLEDGLTVPIDTGFIVFNRVTYPNLCRLFAELDVPTKPSEMSFSVQHVPTGLEYNGMGMNKVFAQRRNLLRPRFLIMLRQIGRFFKVANELIASGNVENLTVREFVKRHQFNQDLLDFYLIPMSSAVWSTEPAGIMDFPADALIRFFHNHGFLGVETHHPWFTVDGGAKTYVDKILARVGAPRVNAGVARIEESRAGVHVTLKNGETLQFDRVILAAHANQSLAMLAAPELGQKRLLGAFRYQRNHATLHTDASVMPARRLAWASWNYRIDKSGRGAVHYWMNALQGVSKKRDYFISLNSQDQIPRDRVLYETIYEHPIFTREAVSAQDELPSLNRRSTAQRVFFCGSYFKYGFHEDAYASAVQLVSELLHTP